MKQYIAGILAVTALCACSKTPETFDKLKIEEGESGMVPLAAMANPPGEEGVVVWQRDDAGIVKAFVRKKVPCPTHVDRSVTAVKYQPDAIVLCYDLLLVPPDQALSACPRDFLIQYELIGIPQDVEPTFRLQEGCGSK